MRALVYVKSAGPAQLVIPLVEIMKSRDDAVRVIADGPAVDLCTKAGLSLYFGGPAGEIAYESFSADLACDIMAAYDPDVFIVAPNGDPFMTTAYLRRQEGAFNGLTRRDWDIFSASVLVGNAYWTARWTLIVVFFSEYLWPLLIRPLFHWFGFA